MDGTITVCSWNVRGEIGASKERIERQLEFLRTHASGVDAFLFQAVNYERVGEDEWSGQLGAFLQYFESERGFECVHTGDWARELSQLTIQPQQNIDAPHNRCTLTASRWPLERTPLTLRNSGNGYPNKLTYYNTNFPEKILVAELALGDSDSFDAEELTLWNVGVINGSNWHEEKIAMAETVYARLYLHTEKVDKPVVLAGDFNAPKRETEEAIVPHEGGGLQYRHYPFYGVPYFFEDAGEKREFLFRDRWKRAERNLFDPAVGEWGMTDAYWDASESEKRSSTEDYTHIVHTGDPSHKRLDHVLVSEHFDTNYCTIWNGEFGSIDGLGTSDHAPVVTELAGLGGVSE
jgi:exonuclease III